MAMAFQWSLAALETLMAEDQMDQHAAVLRAFSVVELYLAALPRVPLVTLGSDGPLSVEIAVQHLFYTGHGRTNACRMRGRAVRSGCVARSAGKRRSVLRNGCPMPYISREILRGSRGDLSNASRRTFLRAPR